MTDRIDAPAICIYGAGAVGGWLAARLARAGARVSVVARGAQLAAIRAQGLRLISPNDDFTVQVAASDKPAELGQQDYVIVATKTTGLTVVAGAIAPLLGPHTTIVPAINGIPWWFFENFAGPLRGIQLASVDPDGVLATAMPLERIIGAVVYPGVSVPTPGVIEGTTGNRVVLGEPSHLSSPRLDRLRHWMLAADFDAPVIDSIHREVLFKLWGNVCFNPISVLTGRSTDELLEDSFVRELFAAVMREAQAITAALGYPIDMTPDERMTITRKLGRVKTSMLQDVEAGRSIELDALVGSMVEIAERLNIPAPSIRAIYGMTRARARLVGLYPQ